MKLSIKQITKKSPDAQLAKELFDASFPPNELMPWWFLMWRTKVSGVEFLAFYDGDIFVGASYIVAEDDFTNVLYLAIDGSHRSKGYGSAVLKAIQERYPSNRISLDIEVLDPATDNYEQRVRRKAFYQKNGFVETGLILNDGGNEYEILAFRGVIVAENYFRVFRLLSGPLLYWRFKPQVYGFSK